MSVALESVGSFSIPPDHSCLPGHFPGQPVIPGALLLDCVLDLIAAHRRAAAVPVQVAVKFLLPVLAGEQVEIRCAESQPGGIGFEAHVGTRRVIAGRIGCASC